MDTLSVWDEKVVYSARDVSYSYRYMGTNENSVKQWWVSIGIASHAMHAYVYRSCKYQRAF